MQTWTKSNLSRRMPISQHLGERLYYVFVLANLTPVPSCPFQGKLTEAEALLWRALAAREAAYGAGHPDVAGSLNNLAAVLKQQ
eukprot:2271162-Pyramimonas_sp.AAC.1